MSYQQITLVGRLGSDPEYKEPNPELKIANIEAEQINRGDTQPDGSTLYYVYKRLQ